MISIRKAKIIAGLALSVLPALEAAATLAFICDEIWGEIICIVPR